MLIGLNHCWTFYIVFIINQPNIFHRIGLVSFLQTLIFKLEEILFIDDRKDVIEILNETGIKAIDVKDIAL